ncbi:RnfABCDGE type electron transport complex subunit D [Spirochaetota bacterium]
MKKPEFLQQKVMLRVIYALIPVTIGAIYFFGWRVLGIIIVSSVFAVITEWIMTTYRKAKISYACFVTSFIFALSLPPTTPFWIVAIGAIVAILFGKEVFGGFGRNVFNPAIVGRAFVYVAFPVELTSRFVPVFRGFPGGFTEWSYELSKKSSLYLQEAALKVQDAISAATPMWANRDFGFVTNVKNLFLGNIGEVFTYNGTRKVLAAGSSGEVCAAIIILAGIYLIATKTAQWRLILSTLLGAVILNLILYYPAGLKDVPPIEFSLFSGGLLFASVFMVTDPISAPKNKGSQWIYGILIGMLTIFFRYKAIFAGGIGFAILFGNMFAPSIDLWINNYKKKKKSKGNE